MKEFVENNKENLKKIYDENYQQGDGLLFIDYRNPEKIDVIFMPEEKLEEFCKQNKIIEFSKVDSIRKLVLYFFFRLSLNLEGTLILPVFEILCIN